MGVEKDFMIIKMDKRIEKILEMIGVEEEIDKKRRSKKRKNKE